MKENGSHVDKCIRKKSTLVILTNATSFEHISHCRPLLIRNAILDDVPMASNPWYGYLKMTRAISKKFSKFMDKDESWWVIRQRSDCSLPIRVNQELFGEKIPPLSKKCASLKMTMTSAGKMLQFSDNLQQNLALDPLSKIPPFTLPSNLEQSWFRDQ